MPPARRNTVWFFFLLALMLVCGYCLMTYAVSSTDRACNGQNGGSVRWVMQPYPRFQCTVAQF